MVELTGPNLYLESLGLQSRISTKGTSQYESKFDHYWFSKNTKVTHEEKIHAYVFVWARDLIQELLEPSLTWI